MVSVTFSDLRSAAFCPRQCYYEWVDDDRDPPPHVERVRSLAFRYDELLRADRLSLAAEPIEIDPAVYQRQLADAKTRHDRWRECCTPASREVLVDGRDCRGIVHKVFEAPLEPVIVSTGTPPDRGVWESHSIVAVAAAKALAWEREQSVESAYVEYPAAAVIRRIDLTTRRKAAYRRTLRTVREIDGPPPRTNDRSKCDHCDYAHKCGVRTRTLRSLLERR
ncbi:hypothetical protein Halru_3117 [Halovivax ruber XH-70]|uniref:CRISPR-associated exonuclease Cas4 n=1 Tax=Halovivax ruber (strain DSM 18193 / JCM 13892 / XH-70) TaxID=797302 RepID=L0IFQ9_HALRX|nr:hypothetical protein [Halovivax ruber]AGB17683.1 hypothetical protein Halru_3117 [Halovivax ruber XH-70]